LGHKIIWSDQALEDVEYTVNYLYEEWSQTAVTNFYKKLERTLKIISTMPNSGKAYPDEPLIRSLGVSKLITLYYEINKNSIEILSLFDNRQNPERDKF